MFRFLAGLAAPLRVSAVGQRVGDPSFQDSVQDGHGVSCRRHEVLVLVASGCRCPAVLAPPCHSPLRVRTAGLATVRHRPLPEPRVIVALGLFGDRVPRVRQQLSLLHGQLCCRLIVYRVPPFPGGFRLAVFPPVVVGPVLLDAVALRVGCSVRRRWSCLSLDAWVCGSTCSVRTGGRRLHSVLGAPAGSWRPLRWGRYRLTLLHLVSGLTPPWRTPCRLGVSLSAFRASWFVRVLPFSPLRASGSLSALRRYCDRALVIGLRRTASSLYDVRLRPCGALRAFASGVGGACGFTRSRGVFFLTPCPGVAIGALAGFVPGAGVLPIDGAVAGRPSSLDVFVDVVAGLLSAGCCPRAGTVRRPLYPAGWFWRLTLAGLVRPPTVPFGLALVIACEADLRPTPAGVAVAVVTAPASVTRSVSGAA